MAPNTENVAVNNKNRQTTPQLRNVDSIFHTQILIFNANSVPNPRSVINGTHFLHVHAQPTHTPQTPSLDIYSKHADFYSNVELNQFRNRIRFSKHSDATLRLLGKAHTYSFISLDAPNCDDWIA